MTAKERYVAMALKDCKTVDALLKVAKECEREGHVEAAAELRKRAQEI